MTTEHKLEYLANIFGRPRGVQAYKAFIDFQQTMRKIQTLEPMTDLDELKNNILRMADKPEDSQP